jgi:hypothetical protein
MKIKTMIGQTGDGRAKYKFSAHVYLEYPTIPIPLKVATGIFRLQKDAEVWAERCVKAMDDDQSWAEVEDSYEMDLWLSMHLPPDDFEREHAQ